MQKESRIVFMLMIIASSIFFTCMQPSGTAGGTDPFEGIAKRELISITGGTYAQTPGFDHTISSFSIGKYEVTYELYYTVYQWAINHGYSFSHPACEGSDGSYGSTPTDAKYEPAAFLEVGTRADYLPYATDWDEGLRVARSN